MKMTAEQKLEAIKDRLYVVEHTTPEFMFRNNGKYIVMTLIGDIKRTIDAQ